MKLRFRPNSLRLRLNKAEVSRLVSHGSLVEKIVFPPDVNMAYMLEAGDHSSASFDGGTVRVEAPRQKIAAWAAADTEGVYFELPANGSVLKVAIEKDLECTDGPETERDPDAFPRNAVFSRSDC